jgi:cobalt-zinc-cadmium efflux system outer membrane protein
MKLGVAAAQMDLFNAELALKRARSDLSTAVRQAYFAVLVDVETLVITRALARFTDDIYRLQIGLLRAKQVAPYEPASLRAQAAATRLAFQQAIASYIYDWKALAATLGLHQLPLSQIAGRVDRLIPFYDYDEVLAYAVQNHTDVLTARNTLRKAQYNLKLAQLTPLVPDVNVYMSVERDFADTPFGTYNQVGVSVPIPVWDQNKGNIIAAQAALVRAGEESHRVEMNLTSGLAAAYGNYKNNLYAMEAYRRNILPDLTRYYRGIFERRQVDPASAFNDLVTAQQTLSANVALYINVLGTLWSSAVSVADFLQTDDLFQLSKQPRGLPELPDLERLPLWQCDHPAFAEAWSAGGGVSHHGGTAPRTGPEPSGPTGPAPTAPAPAAALPSAPATANPPAPPAAPANPFRAQREPVLEPPRTLAPNPAAVP